jgi:DNA primase
MNVEDLLKSKSIPYIPKGKDFVVSCLNPEHPDRNPSMRIDQVTGIFNCFSCQYKGNLFTYFGEKANKMEIRRQLLKKKIDEVRSESIGLQMPEKAMPYVGNWRNIRPETYTDFEAFIHPSKDFVGRICFPVRDRTGRIVAFQARSTGDQQPKYLNSPPGAKMPLFPVVEPIQGRILLVEGIFDVLNLHDKGLTNAVCCFGVKNVTEEKLQVLSVAGIEGVDVFLDNDEAGQTGSAKVRELCEKVGLDSRNIAFGDKSLDAGALVQSQVDKLKSKLYA